MSSKRTIAVLHVFEKRKEKVFLSQVHAPMLILPPLRKGWKGFVALEMLSPFFIIGPAA